MKTEDLPNRLGRHHLRRRALQHDLAVSHRDHPVRVPAGLVQIVQHRDYRRRQRLVELPAQIEHLDLVLVRRGEKVTVQVPLVTVGEHSADVMLVMDQNTISLEVEATHIPTQVEIDITGIQVGTSIRAADLKLPTGAVFPGDPEDLMVSAHAAPTQEQLDASLESAEPAGPAEGADDEG